MAVQVGPKLKLREFGNGSGDDGDFRECGDLELLRLAAAVLGRVCTFIPALFELENLAKALRDESCMAR